MRVRHKLKRAQRAAWASKLITQRIKQLEDMPGPFPNPEDLRAGVVIGPVTGTLEAGNATVSEEGIDAMSENLGEKTPQNFVDQATNSLLHVTGLKPGYWTPEVVVSDGVPVRPKQSFADCDIGTQLILYSVNGGTLSLANKGITSIPGGSVGTGPYVVGIASFMVNGYGAGTLSIAGNSLLTTDLDDIAAALATAALGGMLYDFSGPEMGVLTPVQARSVGSWTITITGVPIGFLSLVGQSTDTGGLSTGDFAGVDADTSAQNLADLINSFGFTGWLASATSNVVTVTVPDAELPLVGNTDTCTNLSIVQIDGQPFIRNADITTIVGSGSAVICEE